MTERLTFKGGWWADVRTEWSYGDDTAIAAALLFTDDPEAFENSQRILLQRSVPAAHVPDLDGNPVDFGPEMWETVNGQVGRAILRRIRRNWGEWQKDADPNDDGASSPASPPGSASASTDD